MAFIPQKSIFPKIGAGGSEMLGGMGFYHATRTMVCTVRGCGKNEARHKGHVIHTPAGVVDRYTCSSCLAARAERLVALAAKEESKA